MKREFGRLERDRFDVLVIGGGIYGAWVAYDAALRGLSVALVEREDWASGTSSASSKLIHGGVRYLERLRIGLVRRGLSERQRLMQLAPHRVRRLPMLMPLRTGDRAGRLKLGLGLWLYDRLAGRARSIEPHRFIDQPTIAREWPELRSAGLLGAFRLWDGQTDDARFTLEVVDGAMRAGVVAVNRARARHLLQVCRTVVGAHIEDLEDGGTLDVRATVTVNCAGPWAQQLVERARPGGPVRTRLSKGVHLVLPSLGRDEALLLLTRAHGGVVFALPWYGRTLVGTTDSDFDGDPDHAQPADAETQYLLDQLNLALSSRFDASDVVARFAGLRTLPYTGEASTAGVSREMLLDEPLDGLLMPIGGKYTSARTDAVKVVDRVMTRMDRGGRRRETTERPFPWRPTGDYAVWLERTVDRACELGLDPQTARNCCERHGTRVDEVLSRIQEAPELAQRIVEDAPFCMAEIIQAVEREMACTLEDVLRRRIPLCLTARVGPETVRRVVDLVAGHLDWSQSRREIEVAAFEGRLVEDHALG